MMRSSLRAALLAASLFAVGTASAQTIEWTAGQLGGGWYTIVSGASKLLEEKVPKLLPNHAPRFVAQGRALRAESWRMLTSMFLHYGVLHLAANLFGSGRDRVTVTRVEPVVVVEVAA